LSVALERLAEVGIEEDSNKAGLLGGTLRVMSFGRWRSVGALGAVCAKDAAGVRVSANIVLVSSAPEAGAYAPPDGRLLPLLANGVGLWA
jgi:hypothetical protein